MRIALLSTFNSPSLQDVLEQFLACDIDIYAIILDSREFSEKDIRVFHERTRGEFANYAPEKFGTYMIPHYFFLSHNSPECADFIRQCNLDVLVNAGMPRILKEDTLRAPTRGVVNLHPGLIPAYRGCTCVEWAVYEDNQVGNTVHFMTSDIDAGPIIMQEPLEFSATDDYTSVRIKTYREGHKLLARAAREIIDEDLRPDALEMPAEGKYYPVIDEEKLEAVKRKLARGEYAYQK